MKIEDIIQSYFKSDKIQSCNASEVIKILLEHQAIEDDNEIIIQLLTNLTLQYSLLEKKLFELNKIKNKRNTFT